MTATGYRHIVRDDEGYLRVEPSWHKVIMLAEAHVGCGWTAEQMVEAHPELTLGQAHEVLAYYYDHKDELDAELSRRERDAEALRSKLEDPELARRLHERFERWRQSRA